MSNICKDAKLKMDLSNYAYYMSGPWEEEEDFYKFREPTTGLKCYVIRMKSGGHLNGYVELPHGSKYRKQIRKVGRLFLGKNRGKKGMVTQPRYERLYKAGVKDVHGGLTFSGKLKPRYSKKFVVGFDCAHYEDLSPLYDRTVGVYRNFEYVKKECLKLAQRLAKLHGL